MTKNLRHILILVFLSSFGFSQPFNLTDTSVKVGQFQHLYEIHFELASANLQSSGLIQLDSLFKFLKNNSKIKIELAVHTDFRGDDNQNLALSKQRATSIQKYLVDNGISADRIKAIGFGENKPVIEYEDWKKLADTHRCGYYGRSNRRVTIVIIST